MFFNPYMAGDPVGKKPSFVGREDILREVLRVLQHPEQNAITLYGQRRVGKTSILQWLEAHLPERGKYRPVYLDLMSIGEQHLDAALRKLAEAIARELELPKPTLQGSVQKAFRKTFLQQMLAALPPDTALVLLMDEFDVQTDPNVDRKIKRAFFSYMRELRSLAPRRLQFVFVLGRTIDDLDIVAKGLFKDLPSMRVSLLQKEDTENLVRLSERDGSLRWTQPAVGTVWNLTHGHPYLVQALCSEVWETVHEREMEDEEPPLARKADVEVAVTPVMARSEHAFVWIWEGLGPAEKVAAAALAEAGPKAVDEDRLEQILSDSGVRILIRELRDAPRQLQEWDILEAGPDGYRFRVELLRRWIAEKHPLERTQQELDRINPVADSLFQAGRGLYENGALDDAREMLERALRLNPSHLGALELLGEVCLAQGNLETARQHLERLYGLAPGRARARLTQVYLQQASVLEDEDARLAAYHKALEIAPDNTEAQKAVQEIETARRQRALRAARKTILQLEKEGNYHTALERARALQETYPDAEFLPALLDRLQASLLQETHKAILHLEKEGNYQAALERAQALQETYPNADFLPALLERLKRKTRLEALYQQAEAALKKGEPEVAVPLLQKIIDLEPTYRRGAAATLLYQAVSGESLTASAKDLAASQPEPTQAKQPATLPEPEKIAETQKTIAPLSIWNPLDYLRLLWWALFRRARLNVYRAAYGEEAEKPVGNRLVLSLALAPLFFPALGLGLNLLPRAETASAPTTYFWLALGVLGLWLFSLFSVERLEKTKDSAIAMGGGIMTDIVALLVVATVAGSVVFGVAGSVVFGVVVCVAVGAAVTVALSVAGIVAFLVVGSVAFFMVSGMASSVADNVPSLVVSIMAADGSVAGVAASLVALGVAGIVAVLLVEGPAGRRAFLGLLGLLAQVLVVFLSLGGLAWLQSGVWPLPVWPF